MNNSISSNASSINSLNSKISTNASSISSLSSSITALSNRVTTLETSSNNSVLSISTGDIIDVNLVDDWGDKEIKYIYDGCRWGSISADTSIVRSLQFEIFINLSYNTIFLLSIDSYLGNTSSISPDPHNEGVLKIFKWSATFNINGKSYTEKAYIPTESQLQKYIKHPFTNYKRQHGYFYIISDTKYGTATGTDANPNYYPCIECTL